VRCIDTAATDARRRELLASLGALVALAAGCASKAPPPAAPPAAVPARPAPPPQAAAPAPLPPLPPLPPPPPEAAPPAAAGKINLGPVVALPPAPPAKNWNDFKRQAARRMVAASPKAAFAGQPPPMLFGIPILEIEVNADGSVRNITVTRPPANIDARDTIDYAMEAIRRGAPYGDMSKLPKPWKWTEVFLFNDKRLFKPRTLD
jgi:hypothetical protein